MPGHDDITAPQVLAANIAFHTTLADDYDKTQPHFRPENVERITSILERLAEETGGGSLLDLGCGTGFVLNIARGIFDRVVGVDVTQAMLDRVDTSSGNVELIRGTTDQIPLPDETFDVCTASSYLHHLYDLEPTLREAHRLLRPGGRFFADQDPNRAYWAQLAAFAHRDGLEGFVAREVAAVNETDEQIASTTDLETTDVRLAEFQKLTLGGFDADDVAAQFRRAGFSSAAYTYHWFLGQGPLLHGEGPEAAAVVESYLRAALPASASLFKYISFTATR
jgi:ubiquinone/menaquinone biosynthesis C-methylase UbiE